MNPSAVDASPGKASRDLSQGTRLKKLAGLLESPRAMSVALAIVLLVAAWFRFHGLNWDSGRHLHPDERFLSTVTNDLKWPANFDTYFNPAASTLSPYSLPRMGLYVYGTFPVYLVKWVAIQLDSNNYDRITLVGRALSVLFDMGAIILLYLVGRRLYGRAVGLLAAGLMAISVLNIQLSHFYAVDIFANFFIVATFYFLLRARSSGRWIDYALTGLALGLGLASKISVMTLAVPILAGAGLDLYERFRGGKAHTSVDQTLVRLLSVFFIAALTFRMVQPIAFNGPSFWGWSLNPRWVEDMIEQQNLISGEADLPWIQQWTGRSFMFPLYNIVVWGMGLPLGLASLAGFGLATFELVRYRKLEHLFPVIYVAATFVYHAAMFVKFMRYFLPIYPFLALMAAYLIVWLWRRAKAPGERPAEQGSKRLNLLSRMRPSRPLALGVAGLVVGGTFLYALAFSAIYSQLNSRIQASLWMYQNLPAGSTLANEHWDDWLPIGGVGGKTAYGDNGMFKSVEMTNYDDDTPDKLNRMMDNLAKADYIVLSSNRLYGSIPRLPMRYPMTRRYYQLLFDGRLGFERIADFTAYPRFFGIQIPDQMAEESFSVYDHPRVQIFKKTAAFNANKVRQALSQGIVWESVLHLTPRQASGSVKSLQLSAKQQALYQNAAIYSSAEVSERSLGSRLPVAAWFIVLEVIGLLALPVTFIALGRLADRGFIFGKAIGLLLVAWGSWMIASVRLAPFTLWTILVVMVMIAIACGLLISRQRWHELFSFARMHWRLLLLEEGLFWIFFAIFLAIRWRNPDLWHPWLGGEKPMDLAYLTAVVRTPFFPPYDPWFAGGYINYYYFGFVLIATLIHLTGVMPYIAYNLAVPTLFAMTAMGGFVVALNFAEGWRSGGREDGRRWLGVGRAALLAGVAGALFVAVIGNLAQVKLLWEGVRNLSSIQAGGSASLLVTLERFADGLKQLLNGRSLQFSTEWWYWNATRVIPAMEGEAGPINEMPIFTFLFADLHAHMMALPYTLLALAIALNIVRDSTRAATATGLRVLWEDPTEALTLALLALTTGALWPMNTWDFPTYAALAAAALLCREYARRGQLDRPALWAVGWRMALVVIAGWLLFLPFHQSSASAYLRAELWKGSRTPLGAYLWIHGFFLFVLVSYLILELVDGHDHNALVRSMRLHLGYWDRRKRLLRLLDLLCRPGPDYRFMASMGKLAIGLVMIVLLINPVIGLALGLSLMTAVLLFSRRPNPRRQFVLCMIGLGLALTAVVEIVVLRGDISRMNTVFKFYLQVWILWAVACAAVLPQLAAALGRTASQAIEPVAEPPEGGAQTPEIAGQIEAARRKPSGRGARLWWLTFGALLAACLLYPLTAAPMRIGDRFEQSRAATLDGSAYMRTSVYRDGGQPITLEWDRQALQWLRRSVPGIPTILEANTPLYRWGSRVSIYTGLPTVIGWDWHQKQQRSVLPGQAIDERIQDVQTMYTSTDPNETRQLLDQYGVRYVYIGPLERLYYAGRGLEKFDQPSDLWHLVYQNQQVKIYQVP